MCKYDTLQIFLCKFSFKIINLYTFDVNILNLILIGLVKTFLGSGQWKSIISNTLDGYVPSGS